MTTRVVQCSGCQTKLRIPLDRTKVRCPKCQESISVNADVPSDSFNSVSRPDRVSGAGNAVFSSQEASQFPVLAANGEKLNVTEFVEPGTGFAVIVGYLALALGVIAVTLTTMGIGLIVLLLAPVVDYFNRKKALALIHGSGLKVNSEQFPQVHACAEQLWNRIGVGETPDVYIIEASVINAFAVRYGNRNVVLLTDDIVHGCLLSKDPRALAFVIGHELAHVALNHNSGMRSTIRNRWKKLSRLDEYTADAIAMALVHDQQPAVEGIVLLTVGPHLVKFINTQTLKAQVQEVKENRYSRKAERHLTHPLLLHRLARAYDRETAV